MEELEPVSGNRLHGWEAYLF